MSVVRRIYEFFDLELTGRRRRPWSGLAGQPQKQKRVHRYALEEFGSNPETERRRFQFYQDFFGIEPEG